METYFLWKGHIPEGLRDLDNNTLQCERFFVGDKLILHMLEKDGGSVEVDISVVRVDTELHMNKEDRLSIAQFVWFKEILEEDKTIQRETFKCPVCGKLTVRHDKRQKVCSDACRVKKYRIKKEQRNLMGG